MVLFITVVLVVVVVVIVTLDDDDDGGSDGCPDSGVVLGGRSGASSGESSSTSGAPAVRAFIAPVFCIRVSKLIGLMRLRLFTISEAGSLFFIPYWKYKFRVD